MARALRLLMILGIMVYLLYWGAVPLHGVPRPANAKIKTVSVHANRSKRIRHGKSPALNFVYARYPDFKGKRGPDGPLAIENKIVDDMHLRRFDKDWQLWLFVMNGLLVHVHESKMLEVDHGLEAPYDYIFPYAAKYIEALPKRLPGVHVRITSLVRSEEYQVMLATKWIRNAKGKRVLNPKWARNAARCGENDMSTCSIHTTALGFDFSTKNLSPRQNLMVANVLYKDQGLGLVKIIYEAGQNHYHVFVIPPKEGN